MSIAALEDEAMNRRLDILRERDAEKAGLVALVEVQRPEN